MNQICEKIIIYTCLTAKNHTFFCTESEQANGLVSTAYWAL